MAESDGMVSEGEFFLNATFLFYCEEQQVLFPSGCTLSLRPAHAYYGYTHKNTCEYVQTLCKNYSVFHIMRKTTVDEYINTMSL